MTGSLIDRGCLTTAVECEETHTANRGKMGKRGFLSEFDTGQILRRYSAVTVMGLLREVAKCDKARLDWNVLVKKLNTGISSARECQALWRHIAYRKELADFYPDDEQLSDDESDLEFELLPSPAVSSEANSEVVRWVKTDVQRCNISVGGKKKGETQGKSKTRDAGLLTDFNQALSGSGKGAGNGVAGDSSTASPPFGTTYQTALANPECTLSKAALGQSERKKRKLWSLEEDQELMSAVEKFGEGNWTNILKGSFTHERTAAQLSQRWALIRKRRESQAAANRLTSSPSAEQANDAQSSPLDQSLEATPATNGANSASVSPVVPPNSSVENGSMDNVLEPSTTTALIPSTSASQGQDHVSNPSSASLNTGVNGVNNGSVAISGSLDSVAVKVGVGTPIRAGTHGGQRQASANGAGSAARSTAGSSTPVAVMPMGQARSAGAKSVSANGGAGRLIAPGAVVMSAAAAQAASVGVKAGTLSTTGALTSGSTKYVGRNNSGGTGGRSKGLTGPDPGVQAAAVAAGARIAPAASLLKGAHSGKNVVHIRQGGVPVTKAGLSSQTGKGHDSNGGSRGSSGAIVHYITTGRSGPPPTLLSGKRPAQQTKNQAPKALGTSQTSSVAANSSTSPTPSNPTPQSK